MTRTGIKVACPHCNSTEIVGEDHILATGFISEWYRDEAGQLQVEWQGSEVHWDTQGPADEEKPYACIDCDERLSEDELVITEE